jgi:hypothetical protein
MMTRKLLFVGIIVLMVAGLFACKKNEGKNSAHLTMHLTDGPASYEAVNIDIQQIGLTMSGSSEIMLTPYRTGVYNILDFKNGLDTLLARIDIPAGTVQQIRLVLGTNNSVRTGGVTYPLNTPSAQESGVKLNLHQTFAANGSYDIWIDFDAAKSIVQTGGGAYKLKPVVRAYSALTNGKIQGYVLPVAAMSTVYAINGTDTSAAIPASTDGYFVISGLPEGSYNLVVSPSVSPYLSYSSTVSVSFGVITNVGTITLP